MNLIRKLASGWRPKPSQSLEPVLDEWGLERQWRKPIADVQFIHIALSEGFHLFHAWCEANGRRALPATPETVLKFLEDGAVSGPALANVFSSINSMHWALWSNEGADPTEALRAYGVTVSDDGVVSIPDSARARFGSGGAPPSNGSS